jgi:hypothetical protein
VEELTDMDGLMKVNAIYRGSDGNPRAVACRTDIGDLIHELHDLAPMDIAKVVRIGRVHEDRATNLGFICIFRF